MTHPRSTVFSSVPQGTPWPSGDYVDLALLALDAAQLASLTGLAMLHGEEAGLGPWAAIAIRLQSGDAIEIISYLDSPTRGTVVRADLACDPGAVFAAVIDLFCIERHAILWVNPRA